MATSSFVEKIRVNNPKVMVEYVSAMEAAEKVVGKSVSAETDSEIFVDLVDQRGRLIEKIKALPENDYRESAECKAMIAQMIPMDKQIIYKARAWLNKSRRQNSTVRSYDLVGAAELRGVVFNKKY